MGTQLCDPSAPQARIHIQIELYALPDALIRNHSTARYLQNKPVSRPPPHLGPLPSPPPREFPLYGTIVRPSPSELVEVLREKLAKRSRFAYVS